MWALHASTHHAYRHRNMKAGLATVLLSNKVQREVVSVRLLTLSGGQQRPAVAALTSPAARQECMLRQSLGARRTCLRLWQG